MHTEWSRGWRWRTKNAARRGRKFLKNKVHRMLRREAKLAARDENFVPTRHVYNAWEVY